MCLAASITSVDLPGVTDCNLELWLSLRCFVTAKKWNQDTCSMDFTSRTIPSLCLLFIHTSIYNHFFLDDLSLTPSLYHRLEIYTGSYCLYLPFLGGWQSESQVWPLSPDCTWTWPCPLLPIADFPTGFLIAPAVLSLSGLRASPTVFPCGRRHPSPHSSYKQLLILKFLEKPSS